MKFLTAVILAIIISGLLIGWAQREGTKMSKDLIASEEKSKPVEYIPPELSGMNNPNNGSANNNQPTEETQIVTTPVNSLTPEEAFDCIKCNMSLETIEAVCNIRFESDRTGTSFHYGIFKGQFNQFTSIGYADTSKYGPETEYYAAVVLNRVGGITHVKFLHHCWKPIEQRGTRVDCY